MSRLFWQPQNELREFEMTDQLVLVASVRNDSMRESFLRTADRRKKNYERGGKLFFSNSNFGQILNRIVSCFCDEIPSHGRNLSLEEWLGAGVHDAKRFPLPEMIGIPTELRRKWDLSR